MAVICFFTEMIAAVHVLSIVAVSGCTHVKTHEHRQDTIPYHTDAETLRQRQIDTHTVANESSCLVTL